MILVDANILLYAFEPSSKQHRRARAWIEEAFSRPQPVRLAWATILAFLRIGTTARILDYPLSIDEAVSIVSGWLARPTLAILEPGERHWAILSDLLQRGQVSGPLVTDAHLAALAIEHGATLCTNDKDFTRFPGLRLLYPLDAD